MSHGLSLSIGTMADLAIIYVEWKRAPRRRSFAQKLIDDYYSSGDKSFLEKASDDLHAYAIASNSIIREAIGLSAGFERLRREGTVTQIPEFLRERDEFRDLLVSFKDKLTHKVVKSSDIEGRIPTFHFKDFEAMCQFFDTRAEAKRFYREDRASFDPPLPPEMYETVLDKQDGRYYFVKLGSVPNELVEAEQAAKPVGAEEDEDE